ncbi:MAG TPA: SLBB domain-containing protein [Chlamydiales bacterium]|nr:SLBB domain-containing protein [Chlamydiales bacterium]
MRWLIFLFLLVGCSTYHTYSAEDLVVDSYSLKIEKEVDKKPSEEIASDEKIILEKDRLKICVIHPQRQDLHSLFENFAPSGYVVENGCIQLYSIGKISIGNLPIDAAKSKIKALLSEKYGFLDISMEFIERPNMIVELIGLVRNPKIPIDGNTRLFSALAQAGISSEANLSKSYLSRDGKMMPIDFYKLIKEGDMSFNIKLKAMDKIYIADSMSASIMVMGEVKMGRVFPMQGNVMPLKEAIALAGGISYTGNLAAIQVIRGNLASPKIYSLSWQHVLQLPTDSLLLIPGDIVYVTAAPITSWNRFVSQILPTFAGVEMVRKGVSGIQVGLP